jgi:hypothetical protein
MRSRELERMSAPGRRRFLKLMGAALAAPLVPQAFRYAAYDMCGVAEAQVPGLPSYLIEINLRDQWDHGELFVAPGIATYANLRRGELGRQCAMFFQQAELVQRPNRVYLTPHSMELDPHLDTVAMIDCLELSVGAIHGHEAGNPMRSPGRTYQSGNGRTEMYLNDPIDNFPQGCEQFYSSTPTPASFYNYYNKKTDPLARNGIAFKGISRGIHTSYHFGAGLPGAELDRMQNRDMLFSAFPETLEDLNVLQSQVEADAMAEILRAVDPKFLQRRRYSEAAVTNHEQNIEEARKLLYTNQTKLISLPLTPEEVDYWGAGIPDQVGQNIKAQIWEQVAWAFKLVSNDLCRAVALEFDYVDVHDQRTVGQMEVMTLQASKSLARLITKLKEAGIYDRTVVAVYCTDGGRAPAAGSQGNEGKNTVILAGGMIRGGYYGDVGIAGDDGDGHVYSYRAPRIEDGQPGPASTDNSGRLAGKYIWRTVNKALGVPDEECQFPDVADAAALPWLLNA